MNSKPSQYKTSRQHTGAAPVSSRITTANHAVINIGAAATAAASSGMTVAFEVQCGLNMQPVTVSKKRTAFENLTNAATGKAISSSFSSSSTLTTTSAVANKPDMNLNNKSDMSKKSRTMQAPATAAAAAEVPAPPTAARPKKVADSFKKTTGSITLSKKTNSKENPALPVAASRKHSISGLPVAKKVDPKQQQQQQQQQKTKSAKEEQQRMDTAQTVRADEPQILEPSMRFADSTESLTGSTGSLNIESSSSAATVVPSHLSSSSPLAESVLGWEDIDAGDEKDEFSSSDYVAHIFKYYRERETKFGVDDYLSRQPHINRQMRLLLVDWMVEVQQQLEFNHEVLYLSVKLLDLYLNKRRIEKEKLQLLGGAVMFIACKFEERMPPIIDDFIYVSDNAYDRDELIKMEIDILKTVRFDIGVPLSYTFLRRYSKCVKADMRFLTLARYILELSLQDYQFAGERDSLKACAALYLALKMTVSHETNLANMLAHNPDSMPADQVHLLSANLTSTDWNPTLIHYTGSFVADFAHLLSSMNNLVRTVAMSKYKTIFKKYSHQVFYEVAKIAPLSDTELQSHIVNAARAQH